MMTNRDELRRRKQLECDQRVDALHRRIPRLGEIAEAISACSLQRIRVGILHKNQEAAAALDKTVQGLMAEKRQILAEHGLTMAVYEPQWQCPLCQDLGYTRPGVPCQCYIQERLDDAFQQSGIPVGLRDYSFDNFDVRYYREPEKMADKVLQCQAFVQRLKAGQQVNNLVFMGDVGRGKTHLSIAIANAALANGNTVIYKRIDDLLDLIRACKYAEDGDAFPLEQLKQCDLLVIDDLGAESITSFAVNQIRIIIEERNLRNKPWIINTNLQLADIEKYYTARVADRIIEKSRLFYFDSAESIRFLRRQQNLV